MDNSKEHEELIDRYLTGMAGEADVEQLDALLKTDEALRESFLSAGRLDAHIHEQALEQTDTEKQPSGNLRKPQFGWVNLGAAAGLLIGLFSASVVWAYILPQTGGITRTSQEIVSESFEDPAMKLKPKLPDKANQWFGRLVSVAPEVGLSAVQGSRVGQLSPVPGNRTESVRYLVDLDDYPRLAEGHVRSLQVKAFFSAPFTKQQPGFRVEMAAFSQAPESVKPVWQDRENFDERVLQEVGRNHLPAEGEQGDWHEVSASLEIPPGSRSVVISLRVWRLNPDKPVSDFYLDAVQVELVDTYEPPAKFASR